MRQVVSTVGYSDDVQITQHLTYFKARASALLFRGTWIYLILK